MSIERKLTARTIKGVSSMPVEELLELSRIRARSRVLLLTLDFLELARLRSRLDLDHSRRLMLGSQRTDLEHRATTDEDDKVEIKDGKAEVKDDKAEVKEDKVEVKDDRVEVKADENKEIKTRVSVFISKCYFRL